MSDLKLGMRYSDVRKRVMRINSSPKGHPKAKENLIGSLLNQARLGEGQKAAEDIARELNGSPTVFSCSGNKQLGACFKFDCVNRKLSCSECLKGSKYSHKTLDGPAPSHQSAERGVKHARSN